MRAVILLFLLIISICHRFGLSEEQSKKYFNLSSIFYSVCYYRLGLNHNNCPILMIFYCFTFEVRLKLVIPKHM